MPMPPRRIRECPDPRLSRLLCQLTLAGLVLVMVWPAARGHHPWLGWLPLWLMAMPAAACWALHRCPLPHRRRRPTAMPRADRTQARRRRRAVVALPPMA